MNDQTVRNHDSRMPAEPVDQIIRPLARFLHIQSASGVVLLVFTVGALILANSAASESYLAFWKTPVGFSIGGFELRHSLKHWINDGLMVIFFFVIGLELKRELVVGELKSLHAAALPIAAALGGMAIPAALYLAVQWGEPGQRGWGIPMATDIAFVVGCLAVLGRRVPHSLRILLLSLAIADDLGAILVIAVGYTSGIHLPSLALGLIGIGVVRLMAGIGVRSVPIYTFLGLIIWFGFHESGVHATIAGVILGLITPVRPWVSEGLLLRFVHELQDFLKGDSAEDARDRHAMLRTLQRATREAISPLERLEVLLHPWVGFVIMPLFAFANAGVPIRIEALMNSVTLAVVVGLVIGKPLGIVLMSWLAVRSGLAKLPESISWSVLAAAGVLAGIGFTMSLFIAGLALSDLALDAAKIGVLIGSTICGVLGMVLLICFLSRPAVQAET